MLCLLHKWEDHKCTKCGKINPSAKCGKCNLSKREIDSDEKEKRARLNAMGAGIVLDMSSVGLLRCPHCGKIACSKCALELPEHDMKTCPFCGKEYSWDSAL